MRYSQIREMDISNGEGVGVALFVQGCSIHCPGCFNQGTWDFNGGKEWTLEVEDKFLELCKRPHVERVSILGGEPLDERNIDEVNGLLSRIRRECPKLKIWLYTGYTIDIIDMEDGSEQYRPDLIDYIVTGPYVHEKRDMNLLYRGSSNQRILDVKKSLDTGENIDYVPEIPNGLK